MTTKDAKLENESNTNKNVKSKFDRANILSKLYCWYSVPFFYKYYGKDFNLDAIDACSKNDQCDRVGNKLRRQWDIELKRKKEGKSASLTRAIIKSFGLQFLMTNVFNLLVYGGFRMMMPLILGRIIFYSNRYFKETKEMNDILRNSTLEINSTKYLNDQMDNSVHDLNYLENLFQQWLGRILTSRDHVILHSLLLALTILVNVLFSHPYFFRQFRYGMNVRVAATKLIYEKALRVTTQSVQRITIGKIVNLISNDANRFDVAYLYVGFAYCAIIETFIGLYFLYIYIDWAFLGAFGLFVFYIPFQAIMANILSRYRSKSIMLTDDRLRLMAEILPAMRVIKMYVWEKPFGALVHLARKMEITKIRQSMILRSINLALYFVAPKIMAFACIILYIYRGGELTAERVFVTLALVAQIRDVITYMFPLAVSYGVEGYISIKRIETFLLEQEIADYQPKSLPTVCLNPSGQSRISLDHVTVSSELDGTIILKDISFEVIPGKLTAIIGPVGSGKSSVLLSILKELPISPSGTLEINGTVVYSSQEAWIFSGTVRDNILFGREFDRKRYWDVVKVAALSKDLAQFEDGDQTMVDDRGTSLSGGQRARISLARALYTDSDCYLLDDPLSAVDASVAKHIFERCIKEYLKEKCVILVTHQLQFIKQADQILVLKDGSCLASGSYLELLARGIDVFKYSAAEPDKPDQISQPNTSSPPGSPSSLKHQTNPLMRFRLDSINSDIFRNSRANSFHEEDNTDRRSSIFDQTSIFDYANLMLNNHDDDHPMSGTIARTIEASGGDGESSRTKRSAFNTYLIYTRAGAGFLLFSTFLISNIITQILFTGSDYWLSVWTDSIEKKSIEIENPEFVFEKNPIISDNSQTNVYIYSAIIFLLFFMAILRTVSYFVICMRSSVNLHNQIFTSLLQAPIMFFDKTPIGIIMNRVSRDLGIIDDLLPPTAFEAIEILGNSVGIFILCTSFNFFISIPLAVLVIMIYLVNRFYIVTARKLKRLEGIARSPLFNQMASTLTGLPTIRSYGVEKMLNEKFSETQDLHSATYFAFISSSRAYGIFLEFMCVIYIYCLMLVLNINLDAYTGSVIGLTISQTLMLTNTFNWGIRQYTEVETYMTSVERIAEFGNLEKEELDKCIIEPGDSWPSKGDISYDSVSLIYNENNCNRDDIDEPPKMVLKNLSFNVRGGEKIGIVGRTGAGKSSLIVTLFRLTEPSGSIKIDGIDTGSISLSRLRRCLSIIPQEPILFSGNIRRNLDPFNEKTDEELWDAVDKVQLRTKIQSMPGKLDSPVSESGTDFSVGQKQLICLARAILRRNRILVLDEATANVDPRTDSFIQSTIRTEFAHCTVLTIAHRLNTIIDYDRVMVLDAGQLAQFGSPYELIKQRSGIFYELYSNLNSDTKAELKRLATKSYAEKQQISSP